MAHNAHTFDVDTKKGFLVGGAEAGAHLDVICAIRAPLVAWPDDEIPADWRARLASHTEYADAPLLNTKLDEKFIDALDIPADERQNGENFPVWASHEGLPPAYLPMDECDPIRDHGFLYAELLQQAGVLTRTDYYKGLPNMFVQFPELPKTPQAGINLSAAIGWLLQERK
ncbi:hypothetical protein JX266_004581 [Neoarthrinium moseri]|nr:hypothetical protein JX266_004581 [Neoarthrinium moseri]